MSKASIHDLRSTHALVTGGTRGLGLAMADALIQAGARVALTSRDAARARSTASRLGDRAAGLVLDVRDEGSVTSAVEEAEARLGPINLLVCNAGIGMRTVNPRFLTEPQPFWLVAPEGFRDVVETKLTGVFLVARRLAPLMLDRGAGRIVVVSMNEQTMTRRGFVPYGPAGAAVEALARVMAADLAGTPVRVNILLPGGATATGMIPEDAEIPDRLRSSLLDAAVMGPPLVWLASSEADGVHDERIVATEFERSLSARQLGRRGSSA